MELEQEQRHESRGDQETAAKERRSEDEPLQPLFPEEELARDRARWDKIQASFVDDPRTAVEQADALVSDLVERLTTGLSGARSRLEDQWGRGEEVSTEDLRMALTRYRAFFNRLLAA